MNTRKLNSLRITLSLVLTIVVATFVLPGCITDVGDGKCPVTFKNRSSYSTYDVVLDGSIIFSLAAGESRQRDIVEGRHTVVFRCANTHRNACSPSEPVFVAGEGRILSCGCNCD